VAQQISYRIRNDRYLSITDRRTLGCAFYPKTQGVTQVLGYDLSFDHRPDTSEMRRQSMVWRVSELQLVKGLQVIWGKLWSAHLGSGRLLGAA
jgi:hypothetical protein